MKIFIQPYDTQFYRDGRPFDAGVETIGVSYPLPYPRTIYGAIRSWIIEKNSDWHNWENNGKITAVVGTIKEFGSLSIKGPILAEKLPKGMQLYFPLPKDIFEKKKNRGELIFLKPEIPKDKNDFFKEFSNLDFKLYPCTAKEEIKEIENYFLSDRYDCLKNYLNDKLNWKRDILVSAELIFNFEPRLGIGLDYERKTAKTGFLYSVSHIRMNENFGFIVDIENDNGLLKDDEIYRLGGDGRPVKVEKVEIDMFEGIKDEIKKGIIENGKFKFYLITPAIFKNNWYPDFLKNENSFLKWVFNGVTIKLVSAILGKPVFIGGFDIAKRYPKPIKKAVPAGSVYFFEIENWSNVNDKDNIINELFEKFFYKSIIDNELSKEGFGITLIGRWK